MLGFVAQGELALRDARELDAAADRWCSMCGPRAQALTAPSHWVLVPDNSSAPAADTEPRVLAFPEETLPHRRVKAASLTGYVREILERAKSCGSGAAPEEDTAWVRLQQAELTITATICWSASTLAKVWVHEYVEIFRPPGVGRLPLWTIEWP